MTLKLRLHPRPSIIARVTPRLSGATLVAGDNITIDQVGNVYTISSADVSAAPLDALAYNGMQINGSMDVSQELGTTVISFPAGAVAPTYLVDGVKAVKGSGAGAYNWRQIVSVFPGYTNEIKLTVTTAQSSIGTDQNYLVFLIEGYRFQRAMWGTANAVPITVGCWIKSSVAGNILAIIDDNIINSTSQISQTLVAGVAQFCTWTFTPPAIWNGSSSNGIGARFTLYYAIASSINILATNGNTLEITGLVILPGSVAPTEEQAPLIMRPYDQELATCQRYYWKSFNQTTAVAQNAGTTGAIHYVAVLAGVSYAGVPVLFPSIMRSTPTITFYNTSASNAKWHNLSTAADSGDAVALVAGDRGFTAVNNPQVAGDSTSQSIYIHATADARL